MTNLARQAESYYCSQCGPDRRLTVRWNGQREECWCPNCRATDGFRSRREFSLTEQWRRDPASVPVAVANKLEKKWGGEPMTTQALARMDEPTMMQRLEKARWMKDVTAVDRPVVAALAVQYGLDPVMGELIIYEGKPYVTFNGWLRKMQEHPQFAGIEDRPMTKEEREQYGYTAAVCWIAKIYRHDWKVPAVGTGTADPEQPYRNNPVERKFPQAFARKRAIIQAGKVGFLHSLPFARQESAEEAGISVNVETGEILAGGTPEPSAVQAEDGEYNLPPTAPDWPDPDQPEPEVAAPPVTAASLRQEIEGLLAKKGKQLPSFKSWLGLEHKIDYDKANVDQLVVTLDLLKNPKKTS